MDDMLRVAWSEYRAWAATSRALESRITRAGVIVLSLTLLGTALGTLGPLVSAGNGFLDLVPWLAPVALGAATYLTSQLLGESERQGWVKARAAAEALKSEACKYVTGASPYNSANAAQVLARRVSEVQRIVPGVLAEPLTAEDRVRNMPTARWSVTDYAQNRVREQIDGFYRPAVARHRAAVRRAKSLALGLGVAAVALSAAGANFGTWPPALLGVVTTAAGAIGAWFQGGRHQQLALNYQAAVAKLELLLAQHITAGMPSTQLVEDAEAVFQAEHAAWLAEWVSPSSTDRGAGAVQPETASSAGNAAVPAQ